MTLRQLVEEKREDIVSIAARHGAKNVRLFGSVARGEDRPDSDVDLLVDTEPITSSWFPAGLILDLEQILGRPVEIVTDKGLNPLIKERVLEEAIPLGRTTASISRTSWSASAESKRTRPTAKMLSFHPERCRTRS